MRKIKISEDAYFDIEEMFSYISQDKSIVNIHIIDNALMILFDCNLNCSDI